MLGVLTAVLDSMLPFSMMLQGSMVIILSGSMSADPAGNADVQHDAAWQCESSMKSALICIFWTMLLSYWLHTGLILTSYCNNTPIGPVLGQHWFSIKLPCNTELILNSYWFHAAELQGLPYLWSQQQERDHFQHWGVSKLTYTQQWPSSV